MYCYDPDVGQIHGARPSSHHDIATGPGGLSSPHHGVTRAITLRVKIHAAQLQQAELLCSLDRRTPVRHPELAVHGALVGLHRVERDIQPLADLTS